MSGIDDRLNRAFLQWPQGRPAKAVDNVVLDRWVESLEVHEAARLSPSALISTGAQGTAIEWRVVDWHRFTPSDFEYDFERDELAEHGVTFNEAVECFFSDCQIRRNKRYRDRYQLLGRCLGGRQLKIIFQLRPRRIVRIITGWPL